MKVKSRILYPGLIVLLFATILAGAYFIYQNQMSTKGDSASVVADLPLYTCPMHPQVIQNGPGQCPICGMDLVPLEQHKHEHGNQSSSGEGSSHSKDESPTEDRLLTVDASVIQKMGVRTQIVHSGEISREMRAATHIDYNETKEIMVNSRVNGWIEKLHANYEGQRVRKGEALAKIYSPELFSTQEEYLQLYTRWKKADESSPVKTELERLLSSARKRLLLWNIDRHQIDQIEKTGKVSRLLTIRSPGPGVIMEKKVIEGARITEGMDLFRIVDLSTIWAIAHIPEKEIPFVKMGMKAKLTGGLIPGKIFQGEVSFISPYLESESRDLIIHITFPNTRGELKPGMYADVLLTAKLPGKHLLIPSSSVISTGERELVFVYRGDGIFEPRSIRTGVTGGPDEVQVIEGLKEGESVVVSGQFLLDSESRFQEAVQKFREDSARKKEQ